MFDLDGTLTESKQPLSREMAGALSRLLTVTKVGIISGGALPQFLLQVVEQLPADARLENLYLLPTSGAALFEYRNGDWQKVYEERLSEKDAAHIAEVIRAAAKETGVLDFSSPSWGERIEYRGSQVTLSALGQQAPIIEKKRWDPDRAKKRALQEVIARDLPDFSVKIGGTTSIDVTMQGIDKAYGVRRLCERLGIPEPDALYVGDELGKDGNDEAVFKTAVETHEVSSPEDTRAFIESFLVQK